MSGPWLIRDVQIELFGTADDPPMNRGYIVADYRNSKKPRYVGADGKWVPQPIQVLIPFTNLADASRIANLTKPPE